MTGEQVKRSPSGSSPVVLLVEDEPLLAMATQAALEEAGYGVVVVADGQRALEELARGLAFYALITDIRLGKGLNGWQLAHCARGNDPGIPVIYVSGDAGQDSDDGPVCGAKVLQKPVTASGLLSALGEVTVGQRN